MKLKELLNENNAINRAGLLPYYIDDEGRVWFALMIPSDPQYGGSSPQIAKGMIDGGEDPVDAAKREAQEELGYIHKNHYEILPGASSLTIQFYYVQVDDKKLNKPHFETGEVLWIKDSDAFKKIRDWQKPILGSIFHKIKKNKKLSQLNNRRKVKL